MRKFLQALRDITASMGHDLIADHPMRRNCCPLNPYYRKKP